MNKILVYLKGFTDEERNALAQITGLWLASGQVPASILPVLINVRQLSFPLFVNSKKIDSSVIKLSGASGQRWDITVLLASSLVNPQRGERRSCCHQYHQEGWFRESTDGLLPQ